MPKAEKGTPKDLANRMKSRGLQKLAFYCQVCEKQARDQNAFKQHCASEPHVRMMILVGQNPNQAIRNFSQQFKHDFLQLLRTAHGEKRVQVNHFYQEYIRNKEHIHMNATSWKTLSEFAKSLGREGICRVDDGEKGLFIAWIDNSPEALNRQAAIKKKDRQDKGDEERANQLIMEQIERAQSEAAVKAGDVSLTSNLRESVVGDTGKKFKICFAMKPSLAATEGAPTAPGTVSEVAHTEVATTKEQDSRAPTATAMPMSMSTKTKTSTSNVFSTSQQKSGPKVSRFSSSAPKFGYTQPAKPLTNAQQMIQEAQRRKQRSN